MLTPCLSPRLPVWALAPLGPVLARPSREAAPRTTAAATVVLDLGTLTSADEKRRNSKKLDAAAQSILAVTLMRGD
jgi:hypothetical protein